MFIERPKWVKNLVKVGSLGVSSAILLTACNTSEFVPTRIIEPTPASTSESGLDLQYYFDIGVRMDKDSLPLRIPVEIKLPSGEKFSFNKEEMSALRDKAITDGEPQLISLFPLDNSYNFNYSAEHPKKLLTEAELQVKELKTIVPQLVNRYRST